MTRYSSDGREERYPELCRDVVHTKPDVIVTAGRDVLCFKAATDTVPVVASMADPVPFGIVASLARPRVEGVEADNACRVARQIVGQRLGQSDTRQAKPVAPRIAIMAVTAMTRNVSSALRSPPPSRNSVPNPQVPTSAMPRLNYSPPMMAPPDSTRGPV